jgi:succinate dehydrogenase/fumarate reductase-like Fe-S protein
VAVVVPALQRRTRLAAAAAAVKDLQSKKTALPVKPLPPEAALRALAVDLAGMDQALAMVAVVVAQPPPQQQAAAAMAHSQAAEVVAAAPA